MDEKRNVNRFVFCDDFGGDIKEEKLKKAVAFAGTVAGLMFAILESLAIQAETKDVAESSEADSCYSYSIKS